MSPRLAALMHRGEVLAVTAAPGGQRLLHFAQTLTRDQHAFAKRLFIG